MVGITQWEETKDGDGTVYTVHDGDGSGRYCQLIGDAWCLLQSCGGQPPTVLGEFPTLDACKVAYLLVVSTR